MALASKSAESSSRWPCLSEIRGCTRSLSTFFCSSDAKGILQSSIVVEYGENAEILDFSRSANSLLTASKPLDLQVILHHILEAYLPMLHARDMPAVSELHHSRTKNNRYSGVCTNQHSKLAHHLIAANAGAETRTTTTAKMKQAHLSEGSMTGSHRWPNGSCARVGARVWAGLGLDR